MNASNGKASAQAVRAALVTSLRCQPLADELCKALEAFSLRAVLHAMRLIAESSLDRDVPVVRTINEKSLVVCLLIVLIPLEGPEVEHGAHFLILYYPWRGWGLV